MDVLQVLHRVPLFSNLDLNSLEGITPLFEEETYAENQNILREGEFGDSMYIIANGKVNVTKFNFEGKEIFISKLGAGTYFGEMALIDNQPRSANVNTCEETKVLRLRKTAFERRLLEDKTLAINFYRNCLNETLYRMRETATNLTSSKTVLDQKSNRLDKLNADLSDAKLIQDLLISSNQLNASCFQKYGIKQTHIYKPYLEVGGDFLNLTSYSEDKIGFIIADVMGHGISAALATGVLRSGFAIFSKEIGLNPIELMSRLNEHVYEIFTSLFATAYYMIIDMGMSTLKLCKGGHMHPLIWKASENCILPIDLPGPGLGIIRKARFQELTVQVERGDKVLFFTDGILEQRNLKGEMFSGERLEQIYKELCQAQNEDIIQSIYGNFTEFCENRDLQDDVTLFLLEF
jgi:serine phosphatase RsbU (regulator of sigma subunit)